MNFLHGLSSLVVAADAAFPPSCDASRLEKSEATGACVTEAVILITSSSEASTAAASECVNPHPKRRRVTGKQSPHLASRKALAVPGQLPIVETHSSEGDRTMYKRWWHLYKRWKCGLQAGQVLIAQHVRRNC